MCFAPADEKGFFDALGSGAFDAQAVCSTIDAMKAMASVEEDKMMITERIKEEVGISSYNEQVRQFLEQQYKFVALRLRGRQANRSVGANGHTGSGRQQRRGFCRGAEAPALAGPPVRRDREETGGDGEETGGGGKQPGTQAGPRL